MFCPQTWKIIRSLSSSIAKNTRKVGVLGVPFQKGQPRPGVKEGPNAIRNTGVLKDLELMGCVVQDHGDVTFNDEESTENIGNMKNLIEVAACNQQVSKCVQDIIKRNQICLTLGGDHSIAIGSIDGHAKALDDDNISVLWVDAHADLNTATSSPSGNMHGMPMAILARELAEMWPKLPCMSWYKPRISVKNVAYIGLRSVDDYERYIIDKYRITAFAMEDIEKYGIVEITERALEAIDPKNNRSLHVSYDIDSLDTSEAPSTGTSVRGGLTLREGITLLEIVHKTKRLAALDLVEVNPNIGGKEEVMKTLEAAKFLIKAAFGHCRKGSSPPEI